jgi:hypothetical protein
MFALTKSCRCDKNLVNLILQSLSLLSKNIENYFPSLAVSSSNWVRDLRIMCFSVNRPKCIRRRRADTNKKGQKTEMKHSSTDMASFWFSLTWVPIIVKREMEELLHLLTLRMCDARFSAKYMMKSKKRLQLQTLEEDLRVCFLTIWPQTRDIMRHHQAQFPADIFMLTFYSNHVYIVAWEPLLGNDCEICSSIAIAK